MEDQEMQVELSPEYQEQLIAERVKAEVYAKLQIEEMNKQIAYSEKLALRDLKKEAFKMAIQIKPQPTYDPMGRTQPTQFSTEDLIKSANKIYDELIK